MNKDTNVRYWYEVTYELNKKINRETPGATIKTDYYFSYVNETNNRIYRFDLVEIADKSLKKVYEICLPTDIEKNSNSLLKQLRFYKELTKVDVYLAYIDDDQELIVLSLEDVKSKHKIVSSFIDFFSSIKELMEALNKGKDKKEKYKFFFRGQPNNVFEPVPIIYRDKYIEYEDLFYREAVRRLPDEFTNEMTTFDKLVKMQGYGLPTRLLDVTTNALVALYFACKEGNDTDGEVLVYPMKQHQIHYFDSDSISVLANLAKCPFDFAFHKNKEDLLYDIKKDNPAFEDESLLENAIKKVICVLPKFNNSSIFNLDGAFFIFGMGETKNEAAALPELPFSISIKAEAKEEIQRDLDELFVINGTLFQERESVMSQIKRELMPDRCS